MYVFHYSSNYYLLLNNTRSNKVDDLHLSLFIKLLLLDNSSAFIFLFDKLYGLMDKTAGC